MEDNNKIQPRHENGDREELEKAGEVEEEVKEGEQEQLIIPELDDPMIQLKS
jgi:hypothetical protein